LPAGLDETYQTALDRIGNDDIGMRALKWVTCAKIHLEAEELQHALAVEQTTRDIDKDDLIEVVDLVSRCAGLVTFDSESGIFRLVHYTTQTFLQDRLQVEGNAEIATTCLRYLSFPRVSNYFPDRVSMALCLMDYKLARYAACYWCEHVRGTSETEFHSQILETFGAQGTRDSVFQIIMEDADIFDNEPSISILLWASMCGLSSLCRKVLDDDDLNSKMKYGSFCQNRLTTRTKESGNEPTQGFESIVEKEDYHFQLSSLGWAARNGEAEVVRLLLDRGAKVDPQPSGEWSPLFCAASNGHIEVMKLLLSNGANVDAHDEGGKSALHTAVKRGDIEMVKFLLEMGANVDIEDICGTSALHTAVKRRDIEMVKFLLEMGPNVDTQDIGGKSALLSAISIGDETVKLLLDKGASVDAQDKDGDLPLHKAVRMGKPEIVKLLLDKGANIEAQGKGEWSALSLAVTLNKAETLECLEILLDRGANVDRQSKDGNSALHNAAYEGHIEIAQLLLDRGANVAARNKVGWSPLSLAAVMGHLEMVNLLLAKGANVDARGHVETLKLFLNAGANANVGREKGDISLLDAICAFHSEENDPDMRQRFAEIISTLE
jgi:ankyrin repeat protein